MSRSSAPLARHGEPTPAAAAPHVRALARELGVDLAEVVGTAEAGRIRVSDVTSHVRRRMTGDSTAQPPTRRPPGPDPAAFGEVERVPMSALRRTIAANVTEGWRIPQVTQHDVADVTGLERYRSAMAEPVTMTAVVLAIVARVLRRFPAFNASLDVDAAEIILKRYVHLGVAVDTDRGLKLVVVRDADRKGLRQIGAELDSLADAARQGRASPDQTTGASFTVTNLGGLGTTQFTPLVTPPMVAVLGVGRARVVATYRDARFEPRTQLPVAISYDHRALDGADAARFVRTFAETIEEPFGLLEVDADR